VKSPLARAYWLVTLAAVLASALFLAFSAASGPPGFPLDDGWIHQTYARNLAEYGEWAFVPGTPSAGSTSPLWTLLLVPAYLLSLPPLAWSYLLGTAILVWLGWAAMAVWQALWPAAGHSWLPGLATVLSWPLVWAAGSGMETLLFAALGLSLCAHYVRAGPQPAPWLGLGAGALILVRPEGVLLLALLAAGLASQRAWRALLGLLLLALLPLLPYFALNVVLSGQWWPNTLYAKQAEYEVLLQEPIWRRGLRLFYLSAGGPETGWRGISGARLLLLPGLIWAGYRAARADGQQRLLVQLLPLIWATGHVGAYAWRLPVTYQHGRYLLAVVPIWIVFGLHGWTLLLGTYSRRRLIRQVAGLSYGLILLLFLFLGAQAYATDVAFIEAEMATTARWLRDNTPPDALVAAHDIGAIGYFSERPLLDLAGLVSPEIIPFIADERAVAGYIRERGAAYLVTAPGWPYEQITSAVGAELVYETGYEWTRAQGVNNMAVYRLPAGEP
jgi:hypothetical protein